MEYILFICGHNAGRSQMAEAYFNYHNENPEVCAISAGTHPAATVNDQVKKVLESHGISLEKYAVGTPKKGTDHMLDMAERVYTMGCNVDCSSVGKPITADFGLEDPAEQEENTVTEIFEKLQKMLDPILLEYNTQTP